jgi:hypothetical protein
MPRKPVETPSIIRQGDVLLVPISAIPPGCTDVALEGGGIVLMHGEVTGRAADANGAHRPAYAPGEGLSVRTLVEPFQAACHYPGTLDVAAVESALATYLQALGLQRSVVRLEKGWPLAQHPPLQTQVADSPTAPQARRWNPTWKTSTHGTALWWHHT